MIDRPSLKSLLPGLLEQNPSPVTARSQDYLQKVQAQTNRIMEVFLQLLPSNYISKVTGPVYTLQFQAVAEQIAEFQITAQEAFGDAFYDFTRSEFLYQILGALVFPGAASDGYPEIQGDITSRQFLKKMVELLLDGATKQTLEQGLSAINKATQSLFMCQNPELVKNCVFEIIEKSIETRKLGEKSGWTIEDQFGIEINVICGDDEVQAFPNDLFSLQENIRIVLRALKPAHVLSEYRHLFQETFGGGSGINLFNDEMFYRWSNYYYEDFRRYCTGAKSILGTQGSTLTDRSLFSDPTRDFSSIDPGADLWVLSGPNGIHAGGLEGTTASIDRREVGRYRVSEILFFPVDFDSTPRSYTTSPSGLSGTATVNGDIVEDPTQNWALAVEGEILTFSQGPNTGSYRLKSILGTNGGFLSDKPPGPSTRAKISPSLLRLENRMANVVSGQSYSLNVDRLGVQVVRSISGEDASEFFYI